MKQRTLRWLVTGVLTGGLATAGTVSALASGSLVNLLSGAGPQIEETEVVVEPTPTGTEEPDGNQNDEATDDLDDGQVDGIDDGEVEDVDDGEVEEIDEVEDNDEAEVDNQDDGEAEDHDDGDAEDVDDEAGVVKFLTITLAMTPGGWKV